MIGGISRGCFLRNGNYFIFEAWVRRVGEDNYEKAYLIYI